MRALNLNNPLEAKFAARGSYVTSAEPNLFDDSDLNGIPGDAPVGVFEIAPRSWASFPDQFGWDWTYAPTHAESRGLSTFSQAYKPHSDLCMCRTCIPSDSPECQDGERWDGQS